MLCKMPSAVCCTRRIGGKNITKYYKRCIMLLRVSTKGTGTENRKTENRKRPSWWNYEDRADPLLLHSKLWHPRS